MMNFIYETFLVDNSGQAVIGDKGFFVLFLIISFIMTIVSSVLGINCIKSDFESTSINQILAFPIKRIEYVGARIFGSWLIAILAFVVSILFTAVLLSTNSGISLIRPELFLAIITASFNMLTVITIAATFSLFLPKLFAFIFTFILRYIISASNSAFAFQGEMGGELTFTKVFTGFFHFLFPRIQPMDGLTQMLLAGKPIDFSVIALLGHYLVTYIFLFIVINWLLSRKDI
jgi:ABC-type transport system involved in multi-copper enzyme maturation permease subunit